MKKHRERIWILAGLILVGILFLLSSTDLILKEEQREIYTVAVILPEDGDALANYRRGIDQAASMENVDIYYETVYKTKAGYDYEAAALQTAEDNPEAVILLGADGGQEGWLDRAGRNIPVVSLGGVQAYGQNSCRITADYRNQGELLAQSILEDSQPGERVIIYSRKWNEEGVLECAEGLESVLKIQGRETLRVADPGMVQGDKAAVLDVEAMSGLLQQEDAAERQLYGAGYTSEAVDAMTEGRIQALVLANEYDMGYLAVKSAVQMIDGKARRPVQKLESILVRPQDVYGQYEAVLFPIS